MMRQTEGYGRVLLESQAVMFITLLVLSIARTLSPGAGVDAVLYASGAGVIALVTLMALLWPETVWLQRFSLALPLFDIVGVRLVVLADGSQHAGLGLLLILPIIWIAYSFGPGGFLVCLVLVAATSPQSFFAGYADTESFDFSRLVAYPLVLIALASVAGVSGVRIRRKRVELAAQTALTERAVRARDDLIEAVTHELRTPLTSILGNAELMGQRSGQPQTVERRASVIVRNAEQMDAILADLLLARSTSPQGLALQYDTTDLRRLLEECAAASRAAADERRVTLAVHQAEPLYAEVDPNRIRQVLDNLLTNAIKYNRVGGTVRVSATRGTETLTLTVTDDGTGIAAADRVRVFEPYYRSAAARESGHPGSGLGLGISRDIARRHGGDLRLLESSAAGSVFELTLPLGVRAGPVSSQRMPARAPVRAALHGRAEPIGGPRDR